MIEAADEAAVAAQLGRPPRAIHAVGHRCPCGLPDVVTTEPRLPDGTPFPTTFYLTCPRAASRIGTLEGSGLMREMADRLAEDPALADGVRRGPRALPVGARRARRGAGDRRASPPAACPTGSSACTCWPARRWPRGAG